MRNTVDYYLYMAKKMGCLETFVIVCTQFEIHASGNKLSRIRLKSTYVPKDREVTFAMKMYDDRIPKMREKEQMKKDLVSNEP